MKSGQNQLTEIPAATHLAEYGDGKVAVLVLEVIAEHRHKTPTTELIDNLSQVSVRPLRRPHFTSPEAMNWSMTTWAPLTKSPYCASQITSSLGPEVA